MAQDDLQEATHAQTMCNAINGNHPSEWCQSLPVPFQICSSSFMFVKSSHHRGQHWIMDTYKSGSRLPMHGCVSLPVLQCITPPPFPEKELKLNPACAGNIKILVGGSQDHVQQALFAGSL